jgi:hypothetical protein
MTSARIDRDEVLAVLSPAAVLDRFDVKGRRTGREFRTKQCPTCGPRSRESVTVNLETGRWQCHAHGCTGDLLALVAGLAGLDARRDFGRVLDIAADIGSVEPRTTTDPAAAAQRRAEFAERTAKREAQELEDARARRAAAIATASTLWAGLPRRSPAGECYLAERGLARFEAPDVVRFTRDGDIAIALRTADAHVVNVVTRYLPGRDTTTKVRGLTGCPTLGTFGHSLSDIAGGRDVVLVEGGFDTLTALALWPDAVVLGAHGASNVPRLGEHAVRRIALCHSRLALVPHADAAGSAAMSAAGCAAVEAGLRLDRDLHVIEVADGVKDLNEMLISHGREATGNIGLKAPQ